MAEMNEFSPYDPGSLPSVIVRYLDVHADPAERHSVAELFAPDARVVDEGIEYSGIERIRAWLHGAASEYVYTTTLIGQRSVEVDRWIVSARLEGNFPGGVADLRYRFGVRGDQISELVIAP